MNVTSESARSLTARLNESSFRYFGPGCGSLAVARRLSRITTLVGTSQATRIRVCHCSAFTDGDVFGPHAFTLTPRITPSAAFQFIETNVLTTAEIVTLTGDDYLDLLRGLGASGVGGGIVYDSLLVKAAELAHVDVLLTLNLKHFQQLWPTNIAKLSTPSLLTPP